MPKFHEVFGQDAYDQSKEVVANRKCAGCPFSGNRCDGGGNRHQTKIDLKKSGLEIFFSDELDEVIPGICSIKSGDEIWITCPRRLLAFPSNPAEVNEGLNDYQKEALIRAGVPTNIDIGVWTEVRLRYKDDDASIKYDFDFLFAPIKRNTTFNWLFSEYKIDDTKEINGIKIAAKAGGYFSGKFDKNKKQRILPDLSNPIFIEVMTASTSGSDKKSRTDIESAFADAIRNREHNCPGINKRQVLGRMHSQIFAKSALAENWNGKTVWLLQDELIKYMESTTGLELSHVDDATEETINILSMSYEGENKGINALKLHSYSESDAGISRNGSKSFTNILLPKKYPDKKILLKAVLRKKLSAIIRL